jgi:25S rRNA (uracil2843-N3)-methyltransferase
MGKNGKFGKDYGKVVGKDSASRPGWKGPGYVKKAEPKPKKSKPVAEKDATTSENSISVQLQQRLLNIFRDTFSEVIDSDNFRQLLQDVKGALYDRDFSRAFGKEEYLEVYSVRWSPSRALGYTSILVGLQDHLDDVFYHGRHSQAGEDNPPAVNAPTTSLAKSKSRVVCLGGGAAEVVAFGGFLKYLTESSIPTTDSDDIDQAMATLALSDEKLNIDLALVDTANWATVVRKLQDGLTTPPPLSMYASASAKEANKALVSSDEVTAKFIERDVLAMSQNGLREVIGQDPILVTLFFTLNELYTTSIGKTTALLLDITATLAPGSLLLVVDSPGSYSETKIGTEEKKYPMKWLLDHTLLETQKSRGQESKAEWEKIHSDDSQWFRLNEDLRYPIQLENMRYQVHLYRRS